EGWPTARASVIEEGLAATEVAVAEGRKGGGGRGCDRGGLGYDEEGLGCGIVGGWLRLRTNYDSGKQRKRVGRLLRREWRRWLCPAKAWLKDSSKIRTVGRRQMRRKEGAQLRVAGSGKGLGWERRAADGHWRGGAWG
ncbi:hypothetical protein GW17_00031333, partial [Ensete ventricosum]